MNKQISFAFEVDSVFENGIRRLSETLGFAMDGGIAVTTEKADQAGVSLHDGRAVIRYARKHQFFRQLGILAEHAQEADFEWTDDGHFTELSMMIDTSHCAMPTEAGMKKLMDRLALMGYSAVVFSAEDSVELEGRPHFGYMKAHYTMAELKALDDYAWDYGMELIPILQCYAHLGKYLQWDEAADIRDTGEVLLAREEKTFAFLEELITKVSGCFRSKRIHIGMDEAWDMGRGTFLDRHGHVPRFEIFTEYMQRLIAITDKLGLVPMMWSDMYFRVCSGGNFYYEDFIEITPEVAKAIPESIELVFWHYGELPHCDDYMLQKHIALNRPVLYAGGMWGWVGHFPEHYYTMESVRYSLNACRQNGVRRAMNTMWLNDNGECDVFANLWGLSFFAELCYDPAISDDKLKKRFSATCDGDWDAFLLMSLYHNRFENGEVYEDFNDRFLGKPLFYQDIMEGLFDTHLWQQPMSGHYADCARRMAAYTGGPWGYLYDFAYQVFAYLAEKAKIHETLVPAYRTGDRETLRRIADEQLPRLKEQITGIHQAHRKMWHQHLKPFGWRGMDDRYGGLASRCDTAQMLLHTYLDGETDSLPQLEEPRLHQDLNGFITYKGSVM